MTLSTQLLDSATAVAGLGAARHDLADLDDDALLAGMRLVRDLEHHLQPYKLGLSAEIARRSDHTLGYAGLARKNGAATPAVLIQSLTGSSTGDATRLARLGSQLVEADDAAANAATSAFGVDDDPASLLPVVAPVASAAAAGTISVDAADAITRGLGAPNEVITADHLRVLAAELLAEATTAAVRAASMPPRVAVMFAAPTPEDLFRQARARRMGLDAAAVDADARTRSAARYVRHHIKNGMATGTWSLPLEDGGQDIDTALKLIVANRTGGPRFTANDTDPETENTGSRTRNTNTNTNSTVTADDRTLEQVKADGFTQVFLTGLGADPNIIPAVQRAAVRIIVTEKTVHTLLTTAEAETDADADGDRLGGRRFTPSTTMQAAGLGAVGAAFTGVHPRAFDDSPIALALLEDSHLPVTAGKLAEQLCEGGMVGILFDTNDSNTIVNVGRDLRLFTRRQRTAMAARDGGCRFPGCRKPPSWCEAHHVRWWKRDGGLSNLDEGILLCRFHHMLIHNNGWDILTTKTTTNANTNANANPNAISNVTTTTARIAGTRANNADPGFWLKPPRDRDPHRNLIPMPTHNPLHHQARAG